MNENTIFKDVFDNIAVGIANLSSDKKFLLVNNQFCKILGYSQVNLENINFNEIIHKDFIEKINSNLKNVNIFNNYNQDIKLIKKDQSSIWVNLTISKIENDSKNTTLIVIQDISDRKNIELSTTLCKEKSNRANCSVKMAQSIAKLGFWEVDFSTGYNFWSEELYDILGITKNSINPSFENFLLFIHKEDIEKVQNDYRLAVQSKSAFKITHRIIKGDGNSIYVETQGVNFFNNAGETIKSIGSIYDINDKIVFENTLKNKVQKQNDELKDKEQLLISQSRLAAMGEMIGNIAHQWRQPLNMLSLKKTILVDDYYDNSITKEDVEKYDTEVDNIIQHMSQTIDDFRNFFLPSKAKEVFSLKLSIEDAIKILYTSLENNYIKFEQYIEKDYNIYGYKSEFQQVVLNIVNNAKDAILMAKDKKLITIGNIILVVKNINNKIFVDITDNGGGIKHDILDKIFEPYFSTKFETQGTGIGLYMSKMIIEKNMNGKLLARNTDHGACFSIELDESINDF
jgi:PAS domain S-box-containing protein